MNSPASAENLKFLAQASDSWTTTPEEYAGRNPGILMWSFHVYDYPEPRMKEWAGEVAEIIQSPARHAACIDEHYLGGDKQIVLTRMRRYAVLEEARNAIKTRQADYEAEYGVSFAWLDELEPKA